MLFDDRLVVIRGGGDLATGAAHAIHRAGFPVVVLELPQPLAIRRRVAFATAVLEGEIVVDATDPIAGRLATSPQEATTLARDGNVAILVAPEVPDFGEAISVLVDARIAKRNIDTTLDQAPLVVALGPGFTAGVDCDAVIETARGHSLGRIIWDGRALPDTGRPGSLGGVAAERVVRAPADGVVTWNADIGDLVDAGDRLGTVGTTPVTATIGGVVRGLITPGIDARTGLKIADVDPRGDRSACVNMSDKARLVGAGVLQAILDWLNRR
jgi:xanthine dehydrogenase accessory factor